MGRNRFYASLLFICYIARSIVKTWDVFDPAVVRNNRQKVQVSLGAVFCFSAVASGVRVSSTRSLLYILGFWSKRRRLLAWMRKPVLEKGGKPLRHDVFSPRSAPTPRHKLTVCHSLPNTFTCYSKYAPSLMPLWTLSFRRPPFIPITSGRPPPWAGQSPFLLVFARHVASSRVGVCRFSPVEGAFFSSSFRARYWKDRPSRPQRLDPHASSVAALANRFSPQARSKGRRLSGVLSIVLNSYRFSDPFGLSSAVSATAIVSRVVLP